MKKIHLFLCLYILVLLVNPAVAEKPNIIIILADDVGIGDISCYGAEKVQTPAIDKLAEEGVRFVQGYAPASVCSPSRYGLLTGSYPCRGPIKSGAVQYKKPLTIDTDSVTLPLLLQQQGYRTAHIGKWHLGYGETTIENWAGELKPGPLEVGFDYHFGLVSNHSDKFNTYVENHHLIWLKDEVTDLEDVPAVDDLKKLRLHDEVDTTLTGKALEFIRNDHESPFFLYLGLVATHTHVTPAAPFRGSSDAGQLGDYLHELDFHVGEIIGELERLGIRDNTLVVFASDNGGQKMDYHTAGKGLHLKSEASDVRRKAKTAKQDAWAMGHRTNSGLRDFKGSIYEGGFRVPFIVSLPETGTQGEDSAQVIALTDIYATIAGVLDVEIPAGNAVDSFDMSGILLKEMEHDVSRNGLILQSASGQLALRRGQWKYILMSPPDWEGEKVILPDEIGELYNLKDDPDESENLSSSRQSVAEEMHKELESLLEAGYSNIEQAAPSFE